MQQPRYQRTIHCHLSPSLTCPAPTPCTYINSTQTTPPVSKLMYRDAPCAASISLMPLLQHKFTSTNHIPPLISRHSKLPTNPQKAQFARVKPRNCHAFTAAVRHACMTSSRSKLSAQPSTRKTPANNAGPPVTSDDSVGARRLHCTHCTYAAVLAVCQSTQCAYFNSDLMTTIDSRCCCCCSSQCY